MPEWLIEEGIGEDRAALVKNGEIIAARVDWHGGLKPGQVVDAELIERTAGSSRGVALFDTFHEIWVDRLPREASEGSKIRLEITRAATEERVRSKPALARPSDKSICQPPILAQTLGARPVRSIDDWNSLYVDAVEKIISFEGGSLIVEPTSALTAIDIDGPLSPKALALAAIPAIAQTIRRLDLTGSVAIDFPTISAKSDRVAIDSALAAALVDWPHEKTAMNGFGLVQLVARRDRPSLLELVEYQPHAAAARWLLRQAERLEGAGRIELSAHPNVIRHLTEDWLTQLSRRTGREVVTRADLKYGNSNGNVQIVPL
ncbi:ribonuclease E/G [Qipengyuania sp. 1NDW9]|uniref:ribonuclease E/G n=1 Tax=Qipengyuania xiapuensis TaxID=2867236 RepID=UPI001C87D1CA|nr:ribonuclease E/G [Qipengyuania xiapuensis]MBX7492506.1 ribonuclease E/G [Qipengyuania xiapuensis]